MLIGIDVADSCRKRASSNCFRVSITKGEHCVAT
jgi:hypothetical protein